MLLTPVLFAQTDVIALSTGATSSGNTASLNLTLTSPTGNEPAAVQWTLTYSTSDVTAISAAAGSAATAAGKSVSCNGGSGTYTCIAFGSNATIISNGTLAVINVTLASTVTSTSIGVTSGLGASAAGSSITVSATGGTVTGSGNPVPTVTSLSPSSATAGGAAFTLTVTGTNFISGSVVNWNGGSRTTTYVSATQVKAAITAADIASAGTAQVSVTNPSPGGGTSGNSAFTISAANNPVPTVTSLSPSSATAGGAAFTLTVTGTNFISGSVVNWNGGSRTTTYVSATQVNAAITAADIASAGTAQVSVTNPAPGGGTSGNSAFTISPASSSGTTYSVWSSSSKPTTVTDPDTQKVELGMKFRANVAGTVTGVRFYKGSQNTGTHIGHLWSNTGTLLASVTFSGETSSGWQLASFATPVSINANTTYVISYVAPGGHYSDDTGFFTSAVTNGPLTALKDGTDGVNGVYKYGSKVFPNTGYQSSNYWVDVVFKPNTASVTSSNRSATKALAGRTGSGPARHSASLSCTPKVVSAGGAFQCVVQADVSNDLTVESSSSNIMLPAVVRGRANQHSAAFEGSVDADAPQETIVISAAGQDWAAEETLMTVAASAPSLSIPGAQLVRYGTTVAFKVSAGSADPVALSAADLPVGASFDASTGVFAWTPAANQQGSYDVTFTAKGIAASSQATVHFDVDAGVPAILNSSQFACSPGAIANLSGRWLGQGDDVADPSGNSTTLGGLSVRVNGTLVPLLFAGRTQASILCPAGQSGDSLQVAAETDSASASIQSTMRATAPALLSADSQQGLVFLSGTNELATSQDARVAGQPAQPGDSLTIRATGLGDHLPIAVRIADTYAAVLSVASAPDAAGVSEIRLTLPASVSFGDAVPVVLEITAPDGKLIRSNSVTVAIEPVRQ